MKKLLRESLYEEENREILKYGKYCYIKRGQKLVKRLPLQEFDNFKENKQEPEESMKQSNQEEISVKN